ncbi:hypothetical protein D3C77_450330 [compost metagenome]
MNFLDATAGSTAATDTAVKLYLPSTEAATVLAYLDRLQALETKQPDPAHARAARSDRIEALVLEALENTTLRTAVTDATPCARTSLIIEHLRKYMTRYRIKKPPSRAKVREVLIKHNYI